MSLQFAPVTKSLLVFLSASTLFVSLFDIGPSLALPPTLAQPYRAFTHAVFLPDSPSLLLALLLLVQTAPTLERRLSSRHLAALLFIIAPLGPVALTAACVYTHAVLVPPSYTYSVGFVTLTPHAATWVLLALLALLTSPVLAVLGVLAAVVYRSPLLPLPIKRFRPPLPFVPDTPTVPRSRRAFPSPVSATAAPSASSMREWVTQLTPATPGVRAPPEEEIVQVTNMFPDLSREAVVGALQRSPNVTAAVDTLLSSS
ncbi:uncharacterized protein BT62DRAFT_785242 [Guyanagaster necrorhizus]|uniref:CUE domain-containing protein n=1 Tax=Guyanagaster necrorhizus TaxID=856835 RepID=A0A9P7VVJ5_9AGAR|nr:uncharacterized protein BT62DRAFT_785242 [Guyanagaster necrorhizus MCA 3950]KAG7447632.1 hypothetical protein BT62DRAFT_785242 [Guyanagaster necrorhizus MCA 3950]